MGCSEQSSSGPVLEICSLDREQIYIHDYIYIYMIGLKTVSLPFYI